MSATGGLIFADERGPASAALLHRLSIEGAIAPAIWLFEAANVIRQAERRNRLATAEVQAARELLLSFPVTVEAADADTLFGPILDLARTHTLTTYDAGYLELALRLRLPLATRDAALIRAAGAEAVAILPA